MEAADQHEGLTTTPSRRGFLGAVFSGRIGALVLIGALTMACGGEGSTGEEGNTASSESSGETLGETNETGFETDQGTGAEDTDEGGNFVPNEGGTDQFPCGEDLLEAEPDPSNPQFLNDMLENYWQCPCDPCWKFNHPDGEDDPDSCPGEGEEKCIFDKDGNPVCDYVKEPKGAGESCTTPVSLGDDPFHGDPCGEGYWCEEDPDENPDIETLENGVCAPLPQCVVQ